MKNKSITIQDIIALNSDVVIKGDLNKAITSIKPIFEADENSVTWLNPARKDKAELLAKTKAGVVICDFETDVSDFADRITFVCTSNPRIVFTRTLREYFAEEVKYLPGIHSTAIINAKAEIHPSAHIGPYCIIGECIIGEGSVIKSHVTINGNVSIGANVVIHEYSNIGSEGFGHIWNEDGTTEKMPHIGKLIIEDDVEILQYVNIDKGTLSNTRILQGAILDHYVHIGHNATVGEYSMVAAKAVFCGGSKIGKRCFVGVQAIIVDAMTIGDNCVIGAGSVVTKHVPDNQVWTGAPAILLEDFKTLQKKLKSL